MYVHTYNNTTPEKYNIREKSHLADRSTFLSFCMYSTGIPVHMHSYVLLLLLHVTFPNMFQKGTKVCLSFLCWRNLIRGLLLVFLVEFPGLRRVVPPNV